MKPITLLKALNDIDDRFIQEAAPSEEKKTGKVINFTSLTKYAAAIAALAFISVVAIRFLRPVVDLNKEHGVEIANPVTEYDSLMEAQKAVGFEFNVPTDINSIPMGSVMVYSGTMIEVNYTEGDELLYSVRKEKEIDDISGDYNTYSLEETVAVDGSDVTIKGDQDLFYLAIWNCDGYSYSLTSDKGMSKVDIVSIVEKIR